MTDVTASSFVRDAMVAVEANDVRLRRRSVKRALDIYLHLQSRLPHDVDTKIASTLSDFYTAMFRCTLDASLANSREGFEQVIAQVTQVREAWKVAARDPLAIQMVQQRRA